jgi:hypothetical protein
MPSPKEQDMADNSNSTTPAFGADDTLDEHLAPELVPPPQVERALALPAPAQSQDWMSDAGPWGGMQNFGNCGDCVIASIGHAIQAWTSATSTRYVIPDDEIVGVYSAITGWTPTSPQIATGYGTVFNYWKKNGIGGRTVEHTQRAYPTSPAQIQTSIKQAVDLFGVAFVIIHVPVAAYDGWANRVPWRGNMGDAIAGSHAVPILGYDDNECGLVTWGAAWTMDWAFVAKYLTQLWAVTSPDWIGANGQSPNNQKLSDLDGFLSKW